MPQEHDPPKKYNISHHRYYELKHFCRQYPEKKKLIEASYGLSCSMGEGSSSPSNSSPTERQAEMFIEEKEDVELIERCVKIACDGDTGFEEYLLRAVTEGKTPNNSIMPCGKNTFYTTYHHRFFYFLDMFLQERRRRARR